MHYQAITTKFHGPTNSRALAERLDWSGVWVSGGLPNGTGDVFVLAANAIAPGCCLEPAFVVEVRS